MSKYTITLFEFASTLTAGTVKEREEALSEWLYESDVGITEDLYSIFKKGFIEHYLFTEIGFETPYLFRNRLNARLLTMSDYFNRLWYLNTLLTSWDPLEDEIDYSEKEKQQTAGNNALEEDQSRQNTDSETYSEDEVEKESSAGEVNQDQLREWNEDRTSHDVTDRDESSSATRDENGNQSQNDTTNKKRGDSDFPQGNIAAGKDYFTTGLVETDESGVNQEHTSKVIDSSTKNTDDEVTGESKGNGTETNNNLQSESSSHNANRNRNEERKKQIEDTLNRILNEINNESKRGKREEHGRRTRRPVPELIEQLKEGYINVPKMMIESCADLFMQIW